jgi:hypothetical protein
MSTRLWRSRRRKFLIANRRYPPELAGMGYLVGSPMIEEPDLENCIAELDADVVVFFYNDLSYPAVMHLACRTVAAAAIVSLIASGYYLVVTPGNGPQVGAQRPRVMHFRQAANGLYVAMAQLAMLLDLD